MRGSYRLIAFISYGLRNKHPRKTEPWVQIRQQHMKDPMWVHRLHIWRQQFAALVEDARITPPEPDAQDHEPTGWYFYADGELHDGYPDMYAAQAALVACSNGGVAEISDIQNAEEQ